MSYDNTGKLLRIQTSLLSALQNEKSKLTPGSLAYEQKKAQIEETLVKYKELVAEVDRGIYHELQDKIKNIVKGNYTYEEELKQLDDLETFYNQYISIQDGFKDTLSLYSSDLLELSPINDLNISYYLRRKDIITNYLSNKKKIVEFKKKIEEYNDELYETEKAKAKQDKTIADLDEELKRKLVSSEGRLIMPNNSLKYTNIINELGNNGIVIKDDDIDEETYLKISLEAKEAKDKYEAAKISYEVRPDPSQKDILEEINKDFLASSYRLSLVRLVKQIFKPSNSYEEALTKRQSILELLDFRKKYLTETGIRFALDPFSRLNVNEQLTKLELFKSVSTDVEKLRKIISQYNIEIDELETCNERNILELNIHDDNTDMVLEKEEKEELPVEKPKKEASKSAFDFIDTSKHVPSNQVVTVKPSKINFKRSQEKGKKVAEKVLELLNRENKAEKQTNPELVIEQKQEDDIFTEETPFINEPSEDSIFETDDPFLDDNNNQDLFTNEEPFIDDKNDIFNDTEPFKETELFSDKVDEEMPDMSMLLDLDN